MNMQIGWYHLKEDTVFTNEFETAAWYERVKVPAGKYPIEVSDYRVRHFDDERRRRFNGEVDGHCSGVYICMDGTIVSDNFQSLFYGSPIGEPYDTGKNAGKPSRHNSFNYLFNVAESILHDPETPYELFPEFEAVEEPFVSDYDGKTHMSHGIYLREGRSA